MTDQTMQALLFTAMKENQVVDMPVPTIDEPDWVLLKVRSAGVCGSDLHGYLGITGRRTPPLIMGHEATADVVAIGDEVTNVSVGDRVVIQPIYFPGGSRLAKDRILMGMNVAGAYAEYVTWPAINLYPLPDHLSYEDGALTEPLSIAVHAVSTAPIRPYDTAFIVGAGPIGLLTLAVLKATGVSEIGISDVSDSRLEMAQDLGASVLVNPQRDNPREVVDGFTNGNGVDIAFEAVGMSATCEQTLAVTRDGGTVVWIGNNKRMVEIDMQAIVTRELKVLGSYGMNEQDFARSLKMLSDGIIPTDQLINRRADISEGATLFDELLASPEIVKCLINFD